MKSDLAIVYLWQEVTGYVSGVLQELTKHVETIDVVHWDKRGINTTQFNPSDSSKVRFHGKTQFGAGKIYDLLVSRNPDIVVISGWADRQYIRACRRYKRLNPNVVVVAGIDSQWIGSIRQQLGRFYYKLFYRRLFDFMWVSGKPQYSFAQKFGYDIENIVTNLYSADTAVFNEVARPLNRFIYVGRFVKVKALDLLVEAYCLLPKEIQGNWPLVLIGDGDQKESILSRGNQNVKILPFMQPDELREELLKGGVACLASHKDNWGVVVHEYALMGMPMLLSSGVGAATEFLISGYNGLIFKKGDVNSLYRQFMKFTSMSNAQLYEYGKNSKLLSSRINNVMSAKSLLSVLNQ